MRIYFSGIGGVGIGPLSVIAKGMGHDVLGSDSTASRYTKQLADGGLDINIGQDGQFLKASHEDKPIDWLVYTSALPPDHPELRVAKKLGIKTSKRDELLNRLISDKKLKLIAVAGTHGKTTTTAMLVWLFKQFNIPVSYSIGTNISFGDYGHYDMNSQYFVYEADEFDRNFLHFSPYASVITSIDYDHSDTFKTPEDYFEAFVEFINSSHCSYAWSRDLEKLPIPINHCVHSYGANEPTDKIKLLGEHNRQNGYLAVKCFADITSGIELPDIVLCLNDYPGVGRRFEKIAKNLYTDYAHHPAEIKATLQLAKEAGKKVVAVYQPHQNIRQHEVKDKYTDCFSDAEHVYWLPTYLSREDDSQDILTPQELIKGLSKPDKAEPAELNNNLKKQIDQHLSAGAIVVLMSAGSLDDWARQQNWPN